MSVEFSARRVSADENNETVLIHFGTMTCEDFVDLMADVIARAGWQFESDPNDIIEWIADRVPASVASSFNILS